MQKRRFVFWGVCIPLFLGAGILPHIELRDSFPQANTVLEGAPGEIWLEFSVVPDTARSTFSVRGPNGGVETEAVQWDEEEAPTFLKAQVTGEMPAGDYLISWVAAPLNDHGGRGRISFSIGVKD